MRAMSLLTLLALIACQGEQATDATNTTDAVGDAETPPETIPAPADVAAAPADAQKTESGIAYKVLQAGTGESPKGPRDTVKVHYTGWTTDGEMFDSSVTRGEPTEFALNRVIAGWTEGVQLMKIGEKTRFWIPEELAYKGRAGAPAGMLVFDIELLEIQYAPEMPPVPEDVAAAPADAERTASGLVSKVLQAGTGAEKPGPNDTVMVNYTGWDPSTQEVLTSTVMRGEPAEMPLGKVLPGWAEGAQLMVVGEKRRLWIPPELGPQKRDGSFLGPATFDFELVEIKKAPPVPADVAKPPADATVTASGLAYKVLQAGTGTEKPTTEQAVEVHYSGWTTDGKMFDSSVMRDRTTTFNVTQVIPGWTEGLQLMVVGEKTRFWIPKEIAYDGAPGKPEGMLVFDVELVAIKDAKPTRPPAMRPGGPGGPGGLKVEMPGGAAGGKQPAGPGGAAKEDGAKE